MASINEIARRNGKKTFRVRIRFKNSTLFDISFDDKIAAQKWIKENEDEVYCDPEKYIKWRHSLFYEMQIKGVEAINHVRKPKPAKKTI